jgi:hypothetical protein
MQDFQNLVDRARRFIRTHGLDNDIEVDDPNVEGRPQDMFVETDSGTWVKAWIFVSKD